MSREACAAQSHDACFLDNGTDLFFWQCPRISVLSQPLYRLIGSVIFNDHRRNHSAVGRPSRLDGLYCTGHGADYICRNKSACLSDLLPRQNPVAFCNQRFCRSTYVLRHRINQFALWKQDLNRFAFRQFFSFIRMDTAFKSRQTHRFFPSFLYIFSFFVNLSHFL